MRRYYPTSLAQEKQDVMSFYAWGDWWTTVPPALKLVKQTVAAFIHVHKKVLFFCLLLHLEADKCVKSWPKGSFINDKSIDMKLWIDFRLRGIFQKFGVAEKKAALIWTVRHYAPFTAQVTDVVSYTVRTLHLILQSLQRL